MDQYYNLIIGLIAIFAVFFILRIFNFAFGRKKFCPNCGYIGRPRTHTKGSIILEIFLWLFFIIPGIIYSLWRLTSRYRACPMCGHRNMIPLDSPRAKKTLESK